MVKIFLTGATGYVGGQALHTIASSLPASSTTITCLVRAKEKADIVRASFPNHVHTVLGDLDDVDLVEEESYKADIVFHLASTNHLTSAQAIARGLSKKPGDARPYWIQISGGSLFVIPEIQAGRYGESAEQEYDDLNGVQQILDVIRKNPSREVDNLIVAQDHSKIRTALVVGPLIYGTGAGRVNQRSMQVEGIVQKTLQDGEGFRFLKGLNQWSTIHIRDLGDLLLLLAEVAIKGDHEGWNHEGIYLPSNGVVSFGQICEQVAREAHAQNLIKSGTIKRTIDVEEADKAIWHGAVLWGTNAVYASQRGQKFLNWRLKAPSLADTIAETVRLEAKRLGEGK